MEIVAGLIKLKPNSKEKVKSWAKAIKAREAEALKTLVDEGVKIESWFSISVDGTDYLLTYTRTEDFSKSQEITKKSNHDIDKLHNEFKKDTWKSGTRATLLVDLDVS